jgi:hypothetical protein
MTEGDVSMERVVEYKDQNIEKKHLNIHSEISNESKVRWVILKILSNEKVKDVLNLGVSLYFFFLINHIQ